MVMFLNIWPPELIYGEDIDRENTFIFYSFICNSCPWTFKDYFLSHDSNEIYLSFILFLQSNQN